VTRRRRLLVAAAVCLLASAFVLPIAGCSRKGVTQAQKWHCPMHPTYVSDRPGDCPICGMSLVPIETRDGGSAHAGHASPAGSRNGGASAASAAVGDALYRCPMHPDVTSREPGRCPRCGMALERVEKPAPPAAQVVYECPMHPEVTSKKPGRCPKCGMALRPRGKDAGVARDADPGHEAPAARVEVAIPADRVQLMGVRTTVATERVVERDLRTVGRVDFDETRLHHVHTKVEGYVEDLRVNFTGKPVRRGEVLFGLYSPELVASQNEYLIALRASRRGGTDGGGADPALAAARKRLGYYDLGPKELAEIEQAGEALRTVPVRARQGGFVLRKQVNEGQRVVPGDTLLEIADLSRVWLLADVYERELPFVRLRQSAKVSTAAVPNQTWEGMVTYIYPTVEEKTRTIKVRIELDNRKGLLKPGMLADVVLRSERGAVRRLAVPGSAVVHTGTRALVFVAREGGRFEPRFVELGEHAGDVIEVRAGLEPGERIVEGANFLLDSESRLRAAIDAMQVGGHKH